MEVVEANDIKPTAKLTILKSWEVDGRALLRAEDEEMAGGPTAPGARRVEIVYGRFDHKITAGTKM